MYGPARAFARTRSPPAAAKSSVFRSPQLSPSRDGTPAVLHSFPQKEANSRTEPRGPRLRLAAEGRGVLFCLSVFSGREGEQGGEGLPVTFAVTLGPGRNSSLRAGFSWDTARIPVPVTFFRCDAQQLPRQFGFLAR